MTELLAVPGGYLLGSLRSATGWPRVFRGEDVRTKGSGNIGASNVLRVYGRWLGVLLTLLDVAKGFVRSLSV